MYRREIDGLRAIAVLPVILFHAGFSTFSGGFVGVDIFFVISGYLITTIILVDKENGTFSLVNFYERRARRILPALFFVMLCCFPFAWLWLTPKHLKEFAQSIVAVSAFSSNFLFWRESGYFATESELKPLLHTWSLSVEEQYYVLFPLFIMLMWKLRKRWLFCSLGIIAIGSLIFAQWGSYNYPSATFFLLHTRGWEIAIGAIIAFYFLYKKDHVSFVSSKKTISEICSVVGVALIAYSIVVFDKSTPFPSLYALIPTLGTALIITFATSQTLVGRLLGTKLLVGIGLISYSTYLWHQPLFVFARHRSLTEPNFITLCLLSCISLILAYLSWRYVEAPFRNKTILNRKKIFIISLSVSIAFVLLGITASLNNGWPSRLPLKDLALATKAEELANTPDHRIINKPKSNLYLIGDSYARQLSNDLNHALYNKGIGFIRNIFDGCPPIKGVYRINLDGGKDCYQFNQDIYNYATINNGIKYIVVAANWQHYINNEDIVIVGKNLESKKENLIELKSLYYRSINELLSSGKKVVLIYPIPSSSNNIPDLLLKNSFFNKVPIKSLNPDDFSTPISDFKSRTADVYEAFDRLGSHPNLIRVLPEKIFCNNTVENMCIVQNNGEIYYRDSGHLSTIGSGQLVNLIMDKINNNENRFETTAVP